MAGAENQNSSLLAEHARDHLEYSRVAARFDQVVDALALREFLNRRDEIGFGDVYRRAAEPLHKPEVLLAQVGHQNQSIKLLDVAQILHKQEANGVGAEDQHVPDAFAILTTPFST